MIKAIETVYDGYKFRSRLEARWAVFFNELGIEWEYEKEGYELGNGERYLPDFWLPIQKIWVEIKGEQPSQEYLNKMERFKDSSGKAIVIFSGLFKYWGLMYAWDLCDSGGGSWEDQVLPYIFDDGEFGFICRDDSRVNGDRTIYATSTFEHEINIVKYEQHHNSNIILKNAYFKAKQARFEHGECG
jgi:hypothetical protein